MMQVNRPIGQTLWRRSGNQDNVWRHTHVTLPADRLSNFTLNFVATTGNGYRGDIAIDDLTIDAGSSINLLHMPHCLFVFINSLRPSVRR